MTHGWDLEKEDDFCVYHINVIISEDEPCETDSNCSPDSEQESQL